MARGGGLCCAVLCYTVTMTITEVARNLYLVPVPIPVPLKYVNCYAARGRSGWTVVDTGFHDALAEAAWLAAFRELGFGPRDVERIVVTHHHPDHVGAAGWLQQLSGAPVFMLDREVPFVDLAWNPANNQGGEIARMFRAHGMPAELTGGIDQLQHRTQELVAPALGCSQCGRATCSPSVTGASGCCGRRGTATA